MATTFKITNIVPNLEEQEMIVFYEFSNGEVFSNKVSTDTSMTDITAWGQEKCVWFDEREEQMELLRQQLLENQLIEE